MKIGIDSMGFYTSRYFLKTSELAVARDIDPDKYSKGLEINSFSMLPIDEDVVTMAANAAHHALKHIDKSQVDALLFATESSIDQSKSAGLYVHKLLSLSPQCRVVELKQACYAATAGVMMACAMVRQNPKSKVLVIGSDNAKYALKNSGEVTQGCGAVAMIISANPRIISLNEKTGFHATSTMDFWRPNYMETALVNGKKSIELYIESLAKSYRAYEEKSGYKLLDHDYFCYHIPFPTMVKKAHKFLYKLNNLDKKSINDALRKIEYVIQYSKYIGNCYTSSLYLSLISLIQNCQDNLSGKRIAFYSYGSGSVGEYFSGVMEGGYKDMINDVESLINTRNSLSIKEYEEFHKFSIPQSDGIHHLPHYKGGKFRLSGIDNHKRIYKEI